MIKRTLIIVGGLVLLGALLFGGVSGLWSHVTQVGSDVQEWVQDKTPIDHELRRAKREVSNLASPIRKAMEDIAHEEVAVERLEKEIDVAKTDLASSKRDILTLKEDLDSGNSNFVYAGRTYTGKQVEEDLRRRFDNFRSMEQTVDQLEKVLAARRNSLAAAQEKLEAMLAAKKSLEIEIAQLEAQHKLNEVAKTTSDFRLDDSQLSRTRELIDRIKTKLAVESKLVNSPQKFNEEIPVNAPEADSNIADEIANYFGNKTTDNGKVEFVGKKN